MHATTTGIRVAPLSSPQQHYRSVCEHELSDRPEQPHLKQEARVSLTSERKTSLVKYRNTDHPSPLQKPVMLFYSVLIHTRLTLLSHRQVGSDQAVDKPLHEPRK